MSAEAEIGERSLLSDLVTAGGGEAWEGARSLLSEALTELNRNRLKGVLEDTDGGASSHRIRDSVLDWLAQRGYLDAGAGGDKAERASLCMELLEHGLRKRDESTAVGAAPDQLFIATPPGPAPFPEYFERASVARRAIDEKLPDLALQARTAEARIGIAVYLLITRAALCHDRLVAAVLSALGRDDAVRIANPYFWIEVRVELDGRMQRRRVFLDPAGLAAWAAARESVFDQLKDLNGRARLNRAIALGRQGWDAFLSSCKELALPAIGRDRLMRAVAAEIQLWTVPLLGSYARGEVASSSWTESTWRRMIGVEAGQHKAEAPTGGRDTVGSLATHAENATDAAIAAPLDEDEFLRDLRVALEPDGRSRNEIQTALAVLHEQTAPGTTRHYLAGWLHHLVEVRHKGKPLALSTVRFYRGTLATRVLALFPEKLGDTPGEELTDLFAEIADTAKSPRLRDRLRKLLSRFNAYCISSGLRVDGGYQLPPTTGAYAEVSACHVTEPEFRQALGRLQEDGTIEDEVFLVLLYRMGLRRMEGLGLTLLETRAGVASANLLVRSNEVRHLKTDNAARRLPYGLLDTDERERVETLWNGRAPEKPSNRKSGDAAARRSTLGTHLLFFPPGTAIPLDQNATHDVPARVTRALRNVTGDKSLHLHHLRHSFATRHALGTLLQDLPDAALAWLPEPIRAMASGAFRFHQLIFARLGRRARRATVVAMAMGHGSETTTLEHYIHGLDVMVHAVVMSRASWVREHRSEEDDGFALNHANEKLVCTLLGKSITTQATERDPLGWLVRQLQRRGVRVEQLKRRSATDTSRKVPTLQWALKQDALKPVPGYPKLQHQMDCARLVLSYLERAFDRDGAAAAMTVELLGGSMRDDGWAPLQVEEVKRLRKYAKQAFDSSLRLQFRGSEYEKRIHRKVELRGRRLGKWLERTTGTIEVRLQEPVARSSLQRQRGMRTVAWTVKAVLAWRGCETSE